MTDDNTISLSREFPNGIPAGFFGNRGGGGRGGAGGGGYSSSREVTRRNPAGTWMLWF